MLETVKDYISNISDMSFEEYYREYIYKVQEVNIKREIEFLVKYNQDLSTLSMIKEINSKLDNWM